MTRRDYAANPADLGEGTLVQLFLEGIDRMGDRPAFRFHDGRGWTDISYRRTQEIVARASHVLKSMGLRRGDRAAILSENRPEWACADYACLAAGIVSVPIYPAVTPEQIEYILRDSGARLIFVSSAEQLEKIDEIRASLPALEAVVSFDDIESDAGRVTSWDVLIERGAQPSDATIGAFRDEALKAGPEDLATIIYTSGTTGDPKGVMLTHDNLRSNVCGVCRVLDIDESDTTLSFLPLSHVLQRMVDFLLFHRGCTIAHGRSIDRVSDDLREVRPTLVVSVPRLYEKVYAKVTEASGLKGAIAQWAIRVGRRWADAKLAGESPGPWTSVRHAAANRLVFKKISDGVGGRLRFFVSGGAPLAPDINRFFYAAGVLILEGYGLTETSPVTNVNSYKDFPQNFRIGTVGKPLPGTEIRIAEDGEILVRGPQVMKGYYQRPDRTSESVTADGWFRTGDIGEIDAEDFLKITDRKKDIIVTAGGKNVAPQPIENRLKTNRFVDQPVLVGDRRKFLSLLLVPDFEVLAGWARTAGVAATDHRELLSDPGVQKLLEQEVFSELDEFSHVEQPKKIILLDGPFTIEDGTLTPTQKIKRKVVEERYRESIDTVYEQSNQKETVFTAW